MNTPIFQLSSAFIIGLMLVFYSVPIIVRVSRAKHLYDEPNNRRVNKVAVPNLGGISLYVGISLGAMLGLQQNVVPEFRFMMISTIILFFIGIKDDLLVISPLKKLIAQLVSAFILIAIGGIRLTHLHGLLGIHEINDLTSYLLSTLVIIGIINAVNLIDGIDGLAASVGILASLVLGIGFMKMGQLNYAIVCMAINGSLLAFFAYNVFGEKNKIFMGDTGALIIGLLLASLIIKFNEFSLSSGSTLSNFAPVLSIAIVAFPVFDMIRLFFLRMIKNKSPFSPDMNHIHHLALKLGLSHLMVTTAISFASLLLIAVLYALRDLNNHILLAVLIAIMAVYLALPRIIGTLVKSKIPAAKTIEMNNYTPPFRKIKQAWHPNTTFTPDEPDQKKQEEQRM